MPSIGTTHSANIRRGKISLQIPFHNNNIELSAPLTHLSDSDGYY